MIAGKIGDRVFGLVLAGGRSSRFGSEKAMAPIGQGVLMDVSVTALSAVCEAIAVSAAVGSGAEAHAGAQGLACLHDHGEDASGPLAGIRRGLEWAADAGGEAGADWLAVAPCDALNLKPEHYVALLQALSAKGCGVVARSAGGLEPLVSIWPVAAGREAVREALKEAGHPSIRTVLAAVGAVEVTLATYDGANINRPDDLL